MTDVKTDEAAELNTRIAKLAHWARAYILDLERQRDRALAQRDDAMMAVTTEHEGATAFVDNGDMPTRLVPLNRYARVQFVTGPGHGEYVTARVMTSPRQGVWLELATGDGDILTRGSASNRLLIKADPDWGKQ
jgi:hypothetical protein